METKGLVRKFLVLLLEAVIVMAGFALLLTLMTIFKFSLALSPLIATCLATIMFSCFLLIFDQIDRLVKIRGIVESKSFFVVLIQAGCGFVFGIVLADRMLKVIYYPDTAPISGFSLIGFIIAVVMISCFGRIKKLIMTSRSRKEGV